MFSVAAFYQFTRIPDPAAWQEPLRAVCLDNAVTGTLLLATEGVNGTIAGPAEGIDATLVHLRRLPGLSDLEVKRSTASHRPFARMKVRLKREIVTMGQPDVDPAAGTGHYVAASDWNALIADPDVVVIDTRNAYETAIGTFHGAIDPRTSSFREFPAWWAANRDRFHNKRIAMFCTGGIRCEKTTNYLLGEGVADVYHLKGGILKYLEEVPQAQSTWTGDCFVFDGRVSVGHGLAEGPHILCNACRQPILPQDRARPEFEQGVACHLCADKTSHADKARFRERQTQIRLARERGDRHMRADITDDHDD